MNFARINAHRCAWKTLAALAIAGFGCLQDCATLPDDGKSAKVMRFDNLRDMRYCEVFLDRRRCSDA